VTNTGNVALTNVVVSDDQEGVIAGPSSGDGNTNGILDVGEVWIYSATGTVTAGQYVNTGSVSAVSVLSQPVADEDPSHHSGSGTLSIGDYVWHDVNDNAEHDEDLTLFGLSGYQVDLYHLLPGSTNLVGSQITTNRLGFEGYYQFTNLPATGLYRVQIATTPPALPVQSTVLSYLLDPLADFTNGVVEFADFGFLNSPATPVRLSAFRVESSVNSITLLWQTAW
jgi:hypothetical protein